MEVVGCVTPEMRIGSVMWEGSMILCRGLHEDLIIGNQFMMEHGGILDLPNRTLFTKGEVIKILMHNKHATPAALRLVRNVTLKPHEAMWVYTRVYGHVRDRKPNRGRYKPRKGPCPAHTYTAVPQTLSCDDFLVQDELINVIKGQSLVRLLNNTNQECKLKAGRKIAIACPISQLAASVASSQGCRTDFWEEGRVGRLLEKLKLTDDTVSVNGKARVKELVVKYADCFKMSDAETREVPYFQCKLNLVHDIPVSARPRATNIQYSAKVRKELERLYQAGIIEDSTSLYNSACLWIPKKNSEEIRCVLDYRKVNGVIQTVPCILPDIRMALSRWYGMQYFASMDLASSFFQLSLCEESRDITSFEVVGVGRYRFTRVPLGLACSPAHLMQAMREVIKGLESNVVSYVDDLIICGKTEDEFLDVLDKLLSRLRKFRLILNPKKCEIMKRRIFTLGHFLSPDGIEVDKEKIQTILSIAPPNTIKKAKSFIGSVQYFSMHIPAISGITKGMIENIKSAGRSKGKLKLNKEGLDSFNAMKQALANCTTLGFPDVESDIILQTDANAYCIASVLLQKQNGKIVPLGFHSKILDKHQILWHINIKELYALYYAIVKRWPHYLKARRFLAQVDNQVILGKNFLKENHDIKLARWLQQLQSFDFKMEYISSADNFLADGLTRSAYLGISTEGVQDVGENHGLVSLYERNENKSPPADESTADNAEEEHPGDPVNSILDTTVTSRSIAVLQDKDEVLSFVKHKVREGNLVKKNEKNMSRDQWRHVRAIRLYELDENDCLVRRYIEQYTGIVRKVICVPDKLQLEIIREVHSSPSGGHWGLDKTLARIKERFYFLDLRMQVQLYINQCVECARVNTEIGRLPKSPLQPYAAKYVGEQINLDFSGPYSRRTHQYRYYILVTDKFSGFIMCRACKNLRASHIVDILMESWFNLFSIPQRIVSDNGAEMKAKIIKEMATVLGINWKYTSPYSPRVNSAAERSHRTIKKAIKKYCMSNPSTWHKYLNMICLSYNNSVHSRHKMTPFYVVTGRLGILPLELNYDVVYTEAYANKEQYTFQLYYKMREIVRMVQNETNRSMKGMSEYYDRGTFVHTYKVGQKVLVRTPFRVGTEFRAFLPKFAGPLTVIKNIADYTYQLQDEAGKIVIAAHDRMRPWVDEERGETVITNPGPQLSEVQKLSLEADQNLDEKDDERSRLQREHAQDPDEEIPQAPGEHDRILREFTKRMESQQDNASDAEDDELTEMVDFPERVREREGSSRANPYEEKAIPETPMRDTVRVPRNLSREISTPPSTEPRAQRTRRPPDRLNISTFKGKSYTTS